MNSHVTQPRKIKSYWRIRTSARVEHNPKITPRVGKFTPLAPCILRFSLLIIRLVI